MMDYLSIKVASKQVAEKSMSDAAARFRGTDKITHAGVSVDGTWQRKGSSLTLGVVTSISIDSGKVLDVVILSKSYKGCTSMKKLSLLISLVMRHGSHLIIVILIVPALPLEWKRQELLRSLVHQKRSMNYITPLFIETVTARNIVLSKTYGPTKLIKKFEFVGHYQKHDNRDNCPEPESAYTSYQYQKDKQDNTSSIIYVPFSDFNVRNRLF